MKEDKPYIDFLKVIGLFGIILAHVDSPEIIMMLRSFDVPFMVILSAILAKQSFSRTAPSVEKSFAYIKRRVKRLVLPTWIFLTFYFILRAVTGTVYNVKYYVLSFLLTRYGIGYVWIVLIYVYCAILVPFFAKTASGKKLWVTTGVVYLLYELMYYLGVGIESKLILSTVYFLIPYGVLTLLGFYYDEMSRKSKIAVCTGSLFLFLILAAIYAVSTGEFQLVQVAKYPPRIYYISYALMASFGLLLFCEGKNNKVFCSRFVRFFSRHSFWIYLWHVLFLWIFDSVVLVQGWLLQFAAVTLCSAATVLVQMKVAKMWESKTGKKIPKYLRG